MSLIWYLAIWMTIVFIISQIRLIYVWRKNRHIHTHPPNASLMPWEARIDLDFARFSQMQESFTYEYEGVNWGRDGF